jgi:hypothetical protein
MHFEEWWGQEDDDLGFLLATGQEGTDGGVEVELHATQQRLLRW